MARGEEHFPVDLPGEPFEAHAVRWTGATIATAALLLLATNAISLDGWAAELAPTPLTARVTDATGGWLALTERTGVATPRAALHAAWKRAQAARLPGQAAAAE